MDPDPVVSKTVPPAEPDQRSPDRITLIAFALFILVGGGVSIGIRFTYSELAPYWGGFLRFTLVAVIFWALAFARRGPYRAAAAWQARLCLEP